ncbi:triple functional domain protein-like isoform X2 [Dinothrombium tinctorium]|uniref:Triple functional domain protein-like isoform X2 n=1 Tax=Dinothrombium tinctorium TaxID=1965070 RepID=A0A3S4QHF1_9ACAR|nr:triple functional domain protein-like isoform X2 [Dinothrombium tinctorium]
MFKYDQCLVCAKNKCTCKPYEEEAPASSLKRASTITHDLISFVKAKEEFALTGECNADEIYGVAQELEANVTKFADKVERRRELLQIALIFFTYEKKLTSWVDELQQKFRRDAEIPFEALEGVEACESSLKDILTR